VGEEEKRARKQRDADSEVSMGKKFQDWQYEQAFMFPPTVKDFIPKEHLSHFIRGVVSEKLDLREIMNDYVEDRGAPPFHPAMMTALLLYSYCRNVYSSRKIAQACEERVDFKVISGMRSPDFRTVNTFRLRHLKALEGLFSQILQLCKEAGLVKLGHVALDGTKIKANAARDRNWKYADIVKEEKNLREEIERWFKEAQRQDEEDDELYGDKRGDELPAWVTDKEEVARRLEQAKKSLEEKQKKKADKRKDAQEKGAKPKAHRKIREVPSGKQLYNMSDPDSAVIKAPVGFIQGFNAQAAVDKKAQIIVACNVSTEADVDELQGMVEKIKQNTKKDPKELSADSGYCSEHNLKFLKLRGINGYVAAARSRDGKVDK
jgi:transposase